MDRFKRFLGVIAAGLIAAIAIPSATDAATKARVAANYGKLPLIFEANRGQTDARVKFLSRGRGYTLFLTDGEAVLSLRGAGGKGHALRVRLLGAEADPKMTGLDRLPGVSNYFIGRDRSKWQTGVPHYAKVGYEGVYPGIDLVFYGTNQRQLEYDFTVAPGADPGAIKLAFEGARRLEINESGDLVATLSDGEVRFLKPVIYQEANGKRRSVAGKYTLAEGNRIGFEIAAYDRTKPLVIDPVLAYSTYLGASGAGTIMNIAVDAAGSAFVIGHTRALDFPTTRGAFQEDHHGELENGTVPEEVFLAKLDASGSELLYATYLGGSLGETGWDVAVDGLGRAYLTGSTSSADFPITTDAFQPVCALDSLGRCSGDVFVAVIDPQGNGVADLAFSSYLGGSGRESGIAIAVDVFGRAYVTGRTTSLDFPGITPASVQQFLSGGQDAFLAVIDPDNAELIYATYLGGTGSVYAWDVAVDLAGRAYLGGYTIEDPATVGVDEGFPTTPGAAQESCAVSPDNPCGGGFVAVVDPQVPGAAGLLYSTLLSGMAGGFVRGVAVAPNCPPPPDGASVPPCTIYVTGGKRSVDDPATEVNEALSDVFVTRISPGGSGAADIVYSTLFGGDNTSEDGMGIAVDSRGLVYVTGTTVPSGYLSSDFPTVNPIQADSGGRHDAFVSVIDPTPNDPVLDDPANDLLFSTYLGGDGQDEARGIALLGPLPPDGSVEVFVTGHTLSSDFPTTAGAFDTSPKPAGKKRGKQDSFRGFISKIALSAADLDNPPEVLITSPANGDTVNGLVTITADATDNDSVTQVEFFLDGTSLGLGTLASGDSMAGQWSLDWVTTLSSEGAHALSATATDTVGKTTSHGISVTVDNTDELPVVTILNPKAGDLLGGTVTVAADASDDRGVDRVEFFVDDGTGSVPTSIGTDADGSDGWSAVWDTTGEPTGDHDYTLIATATDTGAQSASDSIIVTVDNSDDPPTVSIAAPMKDDFVRAGIGVDATASDDRGVAQVEFFVDGASIGVDGASVDTTLGPIWSVGWNTATVGDGPHVLTATATDTSSKQTTSGPVNVTVDNTVPSVSITAPVGGQTLSETFTLEAEASDDNGVESVEFFVDGDGRITSLGVDGDSSGGWSVDLNTGNFVDGAYSLTATATDSVGNKATSPPVTVDLKNVSVAAMHVGDLDDVSRSSKSGWTAWLVVTVHDGNESPLADVTVEFDWVDSFGTTGWSRCITSNTSYSSGQCSVARGSISKAISYVTYTVTDLIHASLTYNSAGNHDPDGDSDGTSITVKKPKK